MPVEKINHRVIREMPEPGPDGVVELRPGTFEPEVRLHWDQLEAQLSMAISVEQLRTVIAEYDSGLRHSGAEEGDIPIYTFALKREDLQRLIRHGRRARNAVYGEDA